MSTALFVPLGIIVARETVDHPWMDERWRPVSAFLNPPEWTDWREMLRGTGYVYYHGGNVEVDLHRKETTAYQVNLTHGEPVVYVVLRADPDASDAFPFVVECATLSPFDAQAYGESGDEIVEAVAMPEALIAAVQAFVDEHHVEETFVKRRRNKQDREDPYIFGQEPPDEVMKRMHGRRARGEAGDV